MATADLKLIYGGGGSFKPTFFSGGLIIPSGSSGTLLTITAPAGKRVRLLSMNTVGGSEPNIRVLADGVAIIGPAATSGAALGSGGQFGIGNIAGGNGGGVGVVVNSSIDYIEALSSITIEKTSGSTALSVYYSYAYGD